MDGVVEGGAEVFAGDGIDVLEAGQGGALAVRRHVRRRMLEGEIVDVVRPYR